MLTLELSLLLAGIDLAEAVLILHVLHADLLFTVVQISINEQKRATFFRLLSFSVLINPVKE